MLVRACAHTHLLLIAFTNGIVMFISRLLEAFVQTMDFCFNIFSSDNNRRVALVYKEGSDHKSFSGLHAPKQIQPLASMFSGILKDIVKSIQRFVCKNMYSTWQLLKAYTQNYLILSCGDIAWRFFIILFFLIFFSPPLCDTLDFGSSRPFYNNLSAVRFWSVLIHSIHSSLAIPTLWKDSFIWWVHRRGYLERLVLTRDYEYNMQQMLDEWGWGNFFLFLKL